MARLSRQKIVISGYCLICICALLVGSCGPKFEEMSAQQIHNYGQAEFENKDYQDAIDAFEALIDLYPFSMYVANAELRIADANFNKRRWVEAEAAYEAFAQRHPNHEEVDHVYFRIGMCNYKEKLAIDRDQAYTSRAEQNFARVVSRYPDSEYIAEAQEKLAEVRRDLAKRERYVARHYWRDKEYYAAFKRWERIIRLFSDTEYYEEALYNAARCLHNLDEDGEARRYLRQLLNKFPEGKYAGKAKNLEAELK